MIFTSDRSGEPHAGKFIERFIFPQIRPDQERGNGNRHPPTDHGGDQSRGRITLQPRRAQAAQEEADLTRKKIVTDFPHIAIRANAADQTGAFHLGERRFDLPVLKLGQRGKFAETPRFLGPFSCDHAGENAPHQIPRNATGQALPEIKFNQTLRIFDLAVRCSLHHQTDHIESDGPVQTV